MREHIEAARLARLAVRLIEDGDLGGARWRLIDAAALLPAPPVHETGRATLITGPRGRRILERLRKVEKVIAEWTGTLWAFCPAWAVNVRAALGMDDNGRYAGEEDNTL